MAASASKTVIVIDYDRNVHIESISSPKDIDKLVGCLADGKTLLVDGYKLSMFFSDLYTKDMKYNGVGSFVYRMLTTNDPVFHHRCIEEIMGTVVIVDDEKSLTMDDWKLHIFKECDDRLYYLNSTTQVIAIYPSGKMKMGRVKTLGEEKYDWPTLRFDPSISDVLGSFLSKEYETSSSFKPEIKLNNEDLIRVDLPGFDRDFVEWTKMYYCPKATEYNPDGNCIFKYATKKRTIKTGFPDINGTVYILNENDFYMDLEYFRAFFEEYKKKIISKWPSWAKIYKPDVLEWRR